jgi:FkbM family methyltransferase
MFEFLKRYYRYFFKNPPKFKIDVKFKTERHGSIYGGWNIKKKSLNKDSIIYSFGVGEDISFDISLIKQYNCQIYAFDPVPRVQNWLSTQIIPLEFNFFNFALFNYDGVLKIFAPENESNISHTIMLNSEKNALNVKCYNLKTIQLMLKHSNIDLLKMDIEGFEYDVIDDIIKNNIKPKQILLEFHHFYPTIGNIKTELYINKIKQYGYNLFYVSNNFCEFSFILI